MKCPACKDEWDGCQCTFEECAYAIRSKAIDEVVKMALEHKGMFATESACKKFAMMARDLRDKG